MARRGTASQAHQRREPVLGGSRLAFGVRAQPAGGGAPPRPPKRSWKARLLRGAVKWMFILAIWAMVGVAGMVAWFAYDLPDISTIHVFNRRPSITFLAGDGQVIAAYGDLHGGVVELKELPPHLARAVLATEDRRFYSHYGIDPIGIARAIYVNLKEGQVVQGGSTITQQLAKNVFLTNERSFRRKIQESILALLIERRFTKDEILTLYLNRVYLGGGAYGVEAAAKRYFGRSARALNRRESAVLAGLLKAPSRYAPTADLEGAKERASQVIANMVNAGFLNQREAAIADDEPLRLASGVTGQRQGRYFADWLMDQVPGFVGFVDRDLVVATTLDSHLQGLAEAEVNIALAREGERANVTQAALVAMSHDGAVRALVGGRNYAESQFNRATNAQRQPGSAFKPFVYLAGVETGLDPNDRLSDGPITIGNWSPKNFDSRFRGEISAREALARSVNTATVRVAQQAGLDRVIAAAHRLGIASPLRRDLSVVLGASEVNLLELTASFTPFANGGDGVLPYAINEIRDTKGRVLFRRSGSGTGRVIAPGALRSMTEMLSAVVTQGTGRGAALDRPAAGKTGTSQDFRDAWFIGFTADLVAGVWLGNDNREPMNAITGGSLPARLWKAFMQPAHRGLAARPLPGMAGAPVARIDVAPSNPAAPASGPLPSLVRESSSPAAPAYRSPAAPPPMPLDPTYRSDGSMPR